MATTYTTPGVYIEEIPKLPRSVAQVATAIPAFIGYTEKALDFNGGSLRNKPTRITSLLEYEGFFGTAQPEDNLEVTFEETQNSANVTIGESVAVEFNGNESLHNLYYSLQAFFANEGGPCYIISIGDYKALGTALVATEFDTGLEALAKEDEPTLIVVPEAQSLSDAEHHALMVSALSQCGKLQDRFTIMDVHDKGTTIITSGQLNTAATAFRSGVAPTNPLNLKYGAAYFPNLRSLFPFAYSEAQITVLHTVNGAAGPLNNQTLSALSAANTAAYNKLKKAIDSFTVILPPSPFVAGAYCSVDASRGVWKAPANVPLAKVIAPVFKVTEEMQGGLNVDPVSGKSINVIRTFTGRGTVVWGARTLAGNDNEWRYVNVRRLFIMVEESCKLATEPFVFEPNDAGTWVKVQAMCENFLTTLWRQGALQGAKPEHAFYVAVGLGKTMSALDILEGRLIVEIGMAAVRPAEFIILRFMHKLPES
jgi:phage tail sheath protein FI